MVLSSRSLGCLLLGALAASTAGAPGQEETRRVEVRLHVAMPAEKARAHTVPAVFWLTPLGSDPLPFPAATGRFTLLQKNRMFSPHLLVVPVGSTVYFPNADPFFHNVFSLFNGKRFDLGLYEAGTTRQEVFSREGVSYIFCNIHPEMSAVIVVLGTPFYAVADAKGDFRMHGVPAGEYEMHVWVEGLTQQSLNRFTRRVEVAAGQGDLGALDASSSAVLPAGHLNKFGRPYDRDAKPVY
jgi:plastocyanin